VEELRRLNSAIDFLRGRTKLSLPQLAARVGLSESYLSDLFKRHIGESPGKFKRRQHLRHIVRELRYRQARVTELWMESEFESPSELSRSVKRAYGYSPRDIQKGARPCLNLTRKERFSKQARFSKGLRPAGINAPKIVELGSLRLAYKRTFRAMTDGNPYQDLLETFQWASSEGLPLFAPWGPIGICYDDFDLDPLSQIVFECGIALPENFAKPLPAWMGLHRQEPGTYAAIRFEGDLEGEEDAIDYFYSGWLPSSGYKLDGRAVLEIFLTESSLLDWNHLKLDLLFPIKKK
jgi:AraC-like DNA-binding protein/DNA gyrase inhibitor GyrI